MTICQHFILSSATSLILFLLPVDSLQAEEGIITSTIAPSDLVEYGTLELEVQRLIDHALELAGMDLGYQYGSASPGHGGMDCSGTIHYLLKELSSIENVPRQANYMYRWVWRESRFHAVNSPNPGGFEWSRLKPGDLLFWSGTYDVDRDPPVTHVMLFLGTMKESGKPVMFGSSSGRRFEGESQHGVSVFDFALPSPESSSRFLGYGSIPGLMAGKALNSHAVK